MKKHRLILLLILLAVTTCYAIDGVYTYMTDGKTRVNPGEKQTIQDTCYQAGTFTTGTTTPDSSHRKYSTFAADANNVIYPLNGRWNVIQIRNMSTTDGDTTVYDVYIAKKDGIFRRISTLTFTTGTQLSNYSGYEYADTLTAANADWHKSASALSPGSDSVAEWAIDVMGASYIGISPTTVTHIAKLEISGY